MTKIICLEGCSGTGKTTQAKYIPIYLAQKGIRCKTINEKDYQPFKNVVLYWHQHNRSEDFTWETIRKFAEARSQTHDHIKKTFPEYDVLLFDRSYFTSAVYQSNNGELDPEKIIGLNLDEGVLEIEQCFLLDCSPELSFNRVLKRAQKLGNSKPHVSIGNNIFPSPHGTIEGISKLHDLYRKLLTNHPEIILIDSSKTEADVSYDIMELL